jgi:hypothetical protein
MAVMVSNPLLVVLQRGTVEVAVEELRLVAVQFPVMAD